MAASIPINLVHFGQANQMKAYALDGRQQAFLGTCAANRFSVIDAQWKLAGHDNKGLLGTVATVFSTFRLLTPLVKLFFTYKKTKNLTDWKTIANKAIDLTLSFEKNFDKAIDKIAPYFEAFCLTSSIGLLFFGHIAFGLLGIATTILIQVKQNGYLPGIIDDALTPVTIIAAFYSIWISPAFLVIRGILLLGNFIQFLNYLVTNNTIRPYLPNFLTDGSTGKHIITPSKALDLKKDKTEISKTLKAFRGLSINRTSVHNPSVKEIFPDSMKVDLDAISYAQLYENVERRISTQKITIKSLDGWKRLKNAMLNDRVPDIRPVNFGFSRNVFKSILFRIQKEIDNEKFESDVQELAVIGEACAEGWLREISFMLNPKTKEYGWKIHHLHAVLRGELLKEALQQLAKELRRGAENNKELEKLAISFDLAGGENNVHLLNQVQAALYHIWHTFEGESFFQIAGRGVFTRLLHRQQQNSFPEDLITPLVGEDENQSPFTTQNVTNILLGATQIILPLPIPGFMLAASIHNVAISNYTSERLVDVVYNAIYPQYRQVKNDRDRYEMQLYRNIEWDVVTKWLGEISEKEIDDGFSVMDDTSFDQPRCSNPSDDRCRVAPGYNPLLVRLDESGNQPFLTKEGVRLMLWDMGILEKSEPKKRTRPFSTWQQQQASYDEFAAV